MNGNPADVSDGEAMPRKQSLERSKRVIAGVLVVDGVVLRLVYQVALVMHF